MCIVKKLVLPMAFVVLVCHGAHAAPKTVDATVAYVMTGDSAVLDNGKVIRYIGVEAPVRGTAQGDEPFGKEAFELNRKLVAGKRIRVETDATESDEKGRIWAYVYVGKYFVNASLVESGYARASVRSPNTRYASLFQKLEVEAREGRRGLWKVPHQSAPVFSNKDLEKGGVPPKASFGNKDLERFDVPGEDEAVAEARARQEDQDGDTPKGVGGETPKSDEKKAAPSDKVEKKTAPKTDGAKPDGDSKKVEGKKEGAK